MATRGLLRLRRGSWWSVSRHRERFPCPKRGVRSLYGGSIDFELVLGAWRDRPGEDEEWGLERVVVKALRSAIEAHGPIVLEHIGSAAKGIVGNVVNPRARPCGPERPTRRAAGPR